MGITPPLFAPATQPRMEQTSMSQPFSIVFLRELLINGRNYTRKLKNFSGYRLRKHLVESLVLSKLDYCDTVYYPLPEFQLKRLQRVQLVAASFVLNSIQLVRNQFGV